MLGTKFSDPRVIKVDENNEPRVFIFGSYVNGNIYELYVNPFKLILYDKYPNNFKPQYHTVFSFNNKI